MTEIPEEVPQLTKIQLYCSALYNVMDENSELMNTGQGDVKVWSGYIGRTADSVGIPEGVRTRVIKRLADIGSIHLVDQGRRGTPSVVALLAPPTGEVWERESSELPLTNRPDPAILAQEVKSILDNLGGVDVKAALANIETRLTKLETQVSKFLSGEGNSEVSS